jgi:hypothetical protein
MGSLPDQVYLDEIPKLRAYPNIRTLGYVATHYADKPIEEVLAEIDIYARWPKIANITKFRVDGIFLDETPSTYDVEEYEYLKTAAQAVRNGTTFKDRFVGTSRHLCVSEARQGIQLTLHSAKPRSHTDHNPQLQSCLPRILPQPHRHHRRLRRSLRQVVRQGHSRPAAVAQDPPLETRSYIALVTKS